MDRGRDRDRGKLPSRSKTLDTERLRSRDKSRNREIDRSKTLDRDRYHREDGKYSNDDISMSRSKNINTPDGPNTDGENDSLTMGMSFAHSIATFPRNSSFTKSKAADQSTNKIPFSPVLGSDESLSFPKRNDSRNDSTHEGIIKMDKFLCLIYLLLFVIIL